MANYQQRLPLRGGSPTLKELRARQFQPSPPSTQPPVSKAPGVNPQQLPLNLQEPAAVAPSRATPADPSYGRSALPVAQVEQLQQGIQQQKAAANQAAADANIARRFQQFNERQVGKVVASNQGALMRTAGGLAAAVPIAIGAYDTAKSVGQKLDGGSGFFGALGTTLSDNINNSLRRSFTGTVGQTPEALLGAYRKGGETQAPPHRVEASLQTPPLGAAGSTSAPITPAPAAPAPAAVPQTPEQVFADLQQQRGFSPLGGVDPNATHSPTLFQRTDALRTRPGSANPNDVQALQDYRQAGFDTAKQEVIAAQDALLLNPKDPKAQQRLAQAEAGFAESRQALMAAQGPLERRQYAGPGGSASGVVAQGTPRGGFVGAATDAEAARNLQARFEQDAAASQIAAGFDRETERLRDARAEKMGISRAKLDASEGRSNPLTDLFAPQGQPAQTEAFSQPGDGFGDAAMRRSVLERRMADTRTSGSERRAAAEAYKGFLSPAHGTGSGGPANGHSPDLFTMVDKLRDNQRADQNLALQGQQLQEARRSNAFNQALNATKEDRAAREQFRVQGKEAEQAVVKDRTQFIKDFTDPKTKRGPDMGALDVLGTQLARSPSLQRADPAMAARFLDGSARYEDLVKVRQMQRIYEESRPGLSTLYLGSPASADEIVQRYFQLNAPQL